VRDIQHEDKYLGSLNVLQKFEAESFIVVSVFNDARNVCDGHPVIVYEFHVSDRRLQRGELVVCYFGQGPGRGSQECRLADVWQAYEANVG